MELQEKPWEKESKWRRTNLDAQLRLAKSIEDEKTALELLRAKGTHSVAKDHLITLIKDQQVLTEIARDQSENETSRAQAVLRLQSVEDLYELLSDKSYKVRLAVIFALSELDIDEITLLKLRDLKFREKSLENYKHKLIHDTNSLLKILTDSNYDFVEIEKAILLR